MKSLLVALSLGVWIAAAEKSMAQADGLYWVSEVPSDPSVTTTDSKTIHLGKPFTEKIDEVDLMSMANDNSKYEFFIHQREDYDTNSPALAFVSQGTCFVITNRGGGTGETERDTVVSDPAEVARLAAYFKITPLKRTAPDCKLTVGFVIRDSGYATTEPILVDFKVTNTGAKTIVLEQPLLLQTRDQNLSFVGTRQTDSGEQVKVAPVQRPQPNGVVLLTSDPSRNISGTLAPGQTISATVNLRDFLVLDQPGTYTIRGTCAVIEIPPGVETGDKWGFVRRNVEWDDSVTGQTEITINPQGR